MTIAVAIKTGSSVVFAADSKVTTRGIVGIEENGAPRWQEQTYDYATKVVHDRTSTLMAMVAGSVNIGQVTATDFISTRSFGLDTSIENQDASIASLVSAMMERKQAYWASTQVPPENWPGPTVLLAAPSPDGITPRVWRVKLEGREPETSKILEGPGINLEGSYDEVFTLIYGFDVTILEDFTKQLGLESDKMWEALKKLKVLRPIDKINLASMPIQDAMDMAVFLAKVQVEMDRFLPGPKACGGPIDVMVLQMAPEPKIVAYPGKVLHHPQLAT